MKLKTLTSRTLPIAALAMALSSYAFAGSDCPDVPKESWIPEAEMKLLIQEKGFSIDSFEIDDHCYEIDGKNASGENVEVSFNPVNGEIVELELED